MSHIDAVCVGVCDFGLSSKPEKTASGLMASTGPILPAYSICEGRLPARKPSPRSEKTQSEHDVTRKMC